MVYDIKNLTKVFDKRTVLNIQHFQVEGGEILGLLGPNGAGKTTLLEILAFLSTPSNGELWFKGERVLFAGHHLRALRRQVVLVQQQPVLFTTTVNRNVAFPLKLRRIPALQRRKIVDELLDLVGMGAFCHKEAHKLSGGETQRVAIAQALACYPEVILLDEPTANVDMENQVTIERIIAEINRAKGISVIFTTHNTIRASRIADRTVFLYEGSVTRSIYENIFSARIEGDAEGGKYCILQSGIEVDVKSDRAGPVHISIDPTALEIHKEKQSYYASKRNTFEGKLVQLTDDQDRVRAVVDVGIPLNVLIPKTVFWGLRLGVGKTVWVHCPKEGIGVF